jgi:hypothetical protein
LRSTRIRKLDDTLVSIPNADFSNIQLHNITQRRRRLYRTTIGLRYETTPDQLRFVIANLREMLTGHPKVVKEPLYVRFIGFGAYSLDLDLFARIRTRDWLEYKAIREDINLRIVDIVKQAGTGFAFPSQTSYFAPDAGLDTERGQEAEDKVGFWRARGKLPFPEFEREEQEVSRIFLTTQPKVRRITRRAKVHRKKTRTQKPIQNPGKSKPRLLEGISAPRMCSSLRMVSNNYTLLD